MSMKTLLWKDYRQNRTVLAAVGVFAMIPYLVALFFLVGGHAFGPASPAATWSELFSGASIWGMVLSVAMAAFIGGNAIAGERVDRSAEFAAYLPIERRSALLSKAIVAIGACVFLCLFNIGVNHAAAPAVPPAREDVPREFFLLTSVTAVLLFGVAWLVSSFSNSAVFATAAAVGVVIILPGALAVLDLSLNPDSGLIHKSCLEWYPSLCLIIGLASFVVGVICYLRRVEP